MRGKSNTSGHLHSKDSMMSARLSRQIPANVTSAIVESPAQSNETTLNDKSPLCEGDIPPMKSSQILEVASTSKEKDLEHFWNSRIKEMSERLWLPTGTDYADSDLRSFPGSSRKAEQKSWFSKKFILAPKKNLLKICYPLSTSSVADSTVLESTLVKSRKIRLYPNAKQRERLRKWMGTARYVYNKTIEYLSQPGTIASWMDIKKSIIDALPKWAKDVPYQIKSIAVKDACNAVKNAKKKAQETGIFQKVKFRSKKRRKDSIYIPKSAVKDQGIYPRLLGKQIQTFKEKIPNIIKFDCRLTFEFGRFFLCVPIRCQRLEPDNQRGELIALDPGVRTFQTFFAIDLAGKFGSYDFSRIYRLCYALDNIISKMASSKCKRRRRLRKAGDRIRFKVRNLIDELHHKVALWLCRYYSVIALPTFETSQMVTKLHSKTSRAMLTWGHFRFKKFLKFKSSELLSRVVDMNEAYTSKTCTDCGKINDIGSKLFLKCICGLLLDRDLNGARNIFLRALVDTPFIVEMMHLLSVGNDC